MRGPYDLSVAIFLSPLLALTPHSFFLKNMFVLIPVDRVLRQKECSRSKIRRVAATSGLLRRPPHPPRIPFRRLGHSKSLTIHSTASASPTKRKKMTWSPSRCIAIPDPSLNRRRNSNIPLIARRPSSPHRQLVLRWMIGRLSSSNCDPFWCRHDRRPRPQRLHPPLWKIRIYWLKSLRPKSM